MGRRKKNPCIVYKMPEGYIQNQRITALAVKNTDKGLVLACWYIGHETGRIICVYCPLYYAPPAYKFKTWKINKDGEFIKDNEGYVKLDSIFYNLSQSKKSHLTEYFPYFSQLEAQPPEKIQRGKIINFTGAKKRMIAAANKEASGDNAELPGGGNHGNRQEA